MRNFFSCALRCWPIGAGDSMSSILPLLLLLLLARPASQTIIAWTVEKRTARTEGEGGGRTWG